MEIIVVFDCSTYSNVFTKLALCKSFFTSSDNFMYCNRKVIPGNSYYVEKPKIDMQEGFNKLRGVFQQPKISFYLLTLGTEEYLRNEPLRDKINKSQEVHRNFFPQ